MRIRQGRKKERIKGKEERKDGRKGGKKGSRKEKDITYAYHSYQECNSCIICIHTYDNWNFGNLLHRNKNMI
jgi:hypothetical protein